MFPLCKLSGVTVCAAWVAAPHILLADEGNLGGEAAEVVVSQDQYA